jgi:hypothetical protein
MRCLATKEMPPHLRAMFDSPPERSAMDQLGIEAVFAAVRGSGADLTDMEHIDTPALVLHLEVSAIVFGFYPDGEMTILKGEHLLEQIAAGRRSWKLRIMGLHLADTRQAEMVGAALLLMGKRQMKRPQIERLAHMLASVQDCGELHLTVASTDTLVTLRQQPWRASAANAENPA